MGLILKLKHKKNPEKNNAILLFFKTNKILSNKVMMAGKSDKA
jgi:hypothetical protein